MTVEVPPDSVTIGPVICQAYKPPTKRSPHWMWRILVRGRGGAVLRCGRWTHDEVVAIAAQLIASGDHLRAGARPKTTGTVREVLAAYEALYGESSQHRPSTRAGTKRSIAHLHRHLDLRVTDLTPDDLARFVRDRISEGMASGTINKELRVLSSAWKHAQASGWLPRGCPPKLKLPIVPHRPAYNHYTPSEDEIVAVMGYLRALPSARSNGATWPWKAVLLAWETGARVGEIEGLRWRAVNEDRGLITLHGKTQSRSVPLSDPLRRELSVWRQDCGHPDAFVLGVRGHIVRSRGNGKLRTACEALAQPAFSWHGIRRAVVRKLNRKGVAVRVAAEIMGHSPMVMLTIYDACTEDDKRDAMRRLSERESAERIDVNTLLDDCS